MNQRGFSFKKCMVGLVLAIAMVIQTPVSGFAADVCTQSNVVQAEGKIKKPPTDVIDGLIFFTRLKRLRQMSGILLLLHFLLKPFRA